MIWVFLWNCSGWGWSRQNSVLFYSCDSLVTLGCFKVRRGGYNDSIARGAFSQSGVRSTDVDAWVRAPSRFEYTYELLKEKPFLQQCNALISRNMFFYFTHILPGCCSSPSITTVESLQRNGDTTGAADWIRKSHLHKGPLHKNTIYSTFVQHICAWP